MSRLRLDPRGIPEGYPFRPEIEISPGDARAALSGSAPFLLIDVRRPDEWEAAHVPGSVLIPLHELESRADEIEAAKDAPIGILCHHGARSLKAASLLRALGFSNARSIVGGIDLWSLAVDAAVPRYDMVGGRCVRLPVQSAAGITSPPAV